MQFICDANQTATDVTIYSSSSLTFSVLIEKQNETSDTCTTVFSLHTGNMLTQSLVEAVC